MPKIDRPKRLIKKVHLDPDLAEWVKKESEIRRCSESQFLRTLVLEAHGRRSRG